MTKRHNEGYQPNNNGLPPIKPIPPKADIVTFLASDRFLNPIGVKSISRLNKGNTFLIGFKTFEGEYEEHLFRSQEERDVSYNGYISFMTGGV